MKQTKNQTTKLLLKEFAKFRKWNAKGLYTMNSNENAEERFNKEIKRIVESDSSLSNKEVD